MSSRRSVATAEESVFLPSTDDLNARLDLRPHDADLTLQMRTGWRVHAATASRIAEDLTNRGGPYFAVVTLARPLIPEQVRALVTMSGVDVERYEAIGQPSQGNTPSVSIVEQDLDDLPNLFGEVGVASKGVVSFTGTIGTTAQYLALAGHPDVVLVDLTGEAAARALRSDRSIASIVGSRPIDIVLNDVYWDYAGVAED